MPRDSGAIQTQCSVATSKSSLKPRASAKEVKFSVCANQGVKSFASCLQAYLRATFSNLLSELFVITQGPSQRDSKRKRSIHTYCQVNSFWNQIKSVARIRVVRQPAICIFFRRLSEQIQAAQRCVSRHWHAFHFHQ